MIRLRYPLSIIALLTLVPFVLQAKEPIRTEEGVVRKVVDGDTVNVVTNEGTKLKSQALWYRRTRDPARQQKSRGRIKARPTVW